MTIVEFHSVTKSTSPFTRSFKALEQTGNRFWLSEFKVKKVKGESPFSPLRSRAVNRVKRNSIKEGHPSEDKQGARVHRNWQIPEAFGPESAEKRESCADCF